MGGTKIFVLQLKQIIRTALFILIGLTIIGLLIYYLIPKGSESKDESALYKPGTYTSSVMLRDDSFNVNVTVNENEIVSVSLSELLQTQEVFFPLIKPAMESLSQEIIRSQTPDITVSADYQETGKLLLQAVKTALDQADPKIHTQ